MIKTSGYRVSPTEIEEVAYATGLVRDAVALGVDDARLGQRDRARRRRADGGAARPRTTCSHVLRSATCRSTWCRRRSSCGTSSRARRTASSTGRCSARSSRRHERPSDDRAPSASSTASSPSAGSRSTGSPSGSAPRRSSPTTGACSPSGSRLLRAALPAGVDLSYAVKANPMPAVVQHLARLVDSLRRRVGGRDADGARHADAARAGQLRRAGQDRRRARARRSRPASPSSWSRRREARRVVAVGERLGMPAARRRAGQPGLRGQGLRHADGRRPAAVRRRRRAGAGAARASSARPTSTSSASTSSPARRTSTPTSSRRRSARPSTWRSQLAESTLRRRSATSTSAAASASRTSTRTSRSTCRGRSEPRRRCSRTRIRPELPEARVVIELGRYIVGECGVYVTRVVDRKVSRGQHLPRRRRRPAPPARRVRQLRPGDPAQLPASRSATGWRGADDDGHGRRLPVHAARPARRQRRLPRPRSATWSSSSRPAPTG